MATLVEELRKQKRILKEYKKYSIDPKVMQESHRLAQDAMALKAIEQNRNNALWRHGQIKTEKELAHLRQKWRVARAIIAPGEKELQGYKEPNAVLQSPDAWSRAEFDIREATRGNPVNSFIVGQLWSVAKLVGRTGESVYAINEQFYTRLLRGDIEGALSIFPKTIEAIGKGIIETPVRIVRNVGNLANAEIDPFSKSMFTFDLALDATAVVGYGKAASTLYKTVTKPGFFQVVKQRVINRYYRITGQRSKIPLLSQFDDIVKNNKNITSIRSGEGVSVDEIAKLTKKTKHEFALVRMENNRLYLIEGTFSDVGMIKGVKRVVAHSHTSGQLALSPADVAYLNRIGQQKLRMVHPKGYWMDIDKSKYLDKYTSRDLEMYRKGQLSAAETRSKLNWLHGGKAK